MKEYDETTQKRVDEIRFMQLVAMFQVAAMQQMGKLVDPVTNKVERDLEQARASIDMIETLKRKTEGNRSSDETEFLDKLLFELHMNYVDESRRPDPAGDSGDAEKDAGSAPDGPDGAESETSDPEK